MCSASTRTATRTARRSLPRTQRSLKDKSPSPQMSAAIDGCCVSLVRAPLAAERGRSRNRQLGAGLAVFLQQEGELVLEVDRPRRPARRDRAKSDELDAIRAAREALTREHLARPRQRGEREALRVLSATRDSAVRSKRAAITLMKGPGLSRPSPARRAALSTHERAARALCAVAHQSLRLRAARHHDRDPRERTTSTRACRGSTRLEAEIKPIVARLAPCLVAEMGVGAIVAAQILCAYSTKDASAQRPRSRHSPASRRSRHPRANVRHRLTARATASSTGRFTRSCSAACETTLAHAPTQPADKPKDAAPAITLPQALHRTPPLRLLPASPPNLADSET